MITIKHIVLAAVAVANMFSAAAQGRTAADAPELPRTILSGPYKAGHIQGIAVDTERRYIYYSYTTMLVKADMQGNVVGSVKGLLGHLGCLDFNDGDGRVYGSLEYKNDAIGKGILRMERSDRQLDNAFYIAVFDVDRITRMDMDAEKDGIMTTVCLPTVLDDYLAEVETAEGRRPHRFGCSGIDGVSFGPRFGKKGGRICLTVAYGIYGETDRSDNDYQVLLQYDTRNWRRYETPLSQSSMHTNGPSRPDGVYFAFTGNTSYGVQNLEYDADTGCWFMAVYRGDKPQYPNYTLFAVDGAARPERKALKGVPYMRFGKVVPLKSRAAVPSGWNFKYGATGLCSLGGGYFYISENYRNGNGQGSVIRLYRFTGAADGPFEVVE